MTTRAAVTTTTKGTRATKATDGKPTSLPEHLANRKARAKETKARLFSAAAELFDAQGYQKTSVDQIARRAKVAKGTFFLHFATKDAVIGELVRIQVRGAKKAREAATTPLGRLQAVVLGLGHMAGMSRPLSRAVLAASIESSTIGGDTDALFHGIFDLMIQDARDAQRAGEIDPSVDPEMMARLLMASYLGATLHFCSSPQAKPLVEILGPLVEANMKSYLPARAAEPRGRDDENRHEGRDRS